MVERTIAWLTRGNRKLRYRGVAKNDHWLHHRAAALNLGRLIKLGLLHNGTAWAWPKPPISQPVAQHNPCTRVCDSRSRDRR